MYIIIVLFFITMCWICLFMLVTIFKNSVHQLLSHTLSDERPCSLDHQVHMYEGESILVPKPPHDSNWTKVYLLPKPGQSEFFPRIIFFWGGTLCIMQDLGSQTKDWTYAPCSGGSGS